MVGAHGSPAIRGRAVDAGVLIFSKLEQIRLLTCSELLEVTDAAGANAGGDCAEEAVVGPTSRSLLESAKGHGP
jgi:hypothetical protein